ncbi:DUF484 family protein [Stenoxybacter acetivorans]|uniref:DUF484 family protein n=1 Tax=Stenoxybacter acetivorans TaxID=422441 RepID=UPI00056287B8|nr:DUF484 family protein [Stenoxybacter acetivorans]
MSAKQSVNVQQVLAFLENHPDFLVQYAEKLGFRPQENKVLSFNQGKLAQMQQKSERTHTLMQQIIADTQHNSIVMQKLLAFTHRLLLTANLTQLVKAVDAGLRQDFSLPNYAFKILPPEISKAKIPKILLWQTEISAEAAADFYHVQCGSQIHAAIQALLIQQNPSLMSFLQLPVVWQGKTIAFLAIGHEDSGYFHADLSTDLAAQLAANLAAVLARLLRLPE